MVVKSLEKKKTRTPEPYDHAKLARRRGILRFLLKYLGIPLLAKLDRVDGLENLPKEGPALLMMNHNALIDSIVVVHSVPRDIVPLAKIEVYDYPVVGIFPRIWEVIPVRREEVDKQTIKRTFEVLNAGELVLIAPDIDTDTFRQDLDQLKSVVRRITIYVSENDKALKVSNEVHGNPRLGQAGEHLTIFEQVESIDISAIGTRRFSGHIYHLFNPEVIDDLTELLTTGKSAAQRSRLKATQNEGLRYWLLQPADE